MRIQNERMFFTLTYVQVVCLNFVACFFIAFIAVLFGGAAAFATFIAFIAMARRLAGKMRWRRLVAMGLQTLNLEAAEPLYLMLYKSGRATTFSGGVLEHKGFRTLLDPTGATHRPRTMIGYWLAGWLAG